MNVKFSTQLFLFLLCSLPCILIAGEHGNQFQHPITTGEQFTTATSCPNCGMNVNMWARTRHQFTLNGATHETCSIRCLADMTMKAGEGAKDIKASLYFEPQTMDAATEGWYVIGSTATGTMTKKSKIFFNSKTKAEAFIASHGGAAVQLDAALQQAQKELTPMRKMLEQKRIKKGKIAVPDENASCVNCGMHPARYPAFRSQMSSKATGRQHFCSSKCLIKYKATLDEKPSSVWVTVYPDGDTEFAKGLYYVVNSDVMGPMGPEALPFRKRLDASTFIKEHGGTIYTYEQLNPSLFGGTMHHKMH